MTTTSKKTLDLSSADKRRVHALRLMTRAMARYEWTAADLRHMESAIDFAKEMRSCRTAAFLRPGDEVSFPSGKGKGLRLAIVSKVRRNHAIVTFEEAGTVVARNVPLSAVTLMRTSAKVTLDRLADEEEAAVTAQAIAEANQAVAPIEVL